MMPLWVPYSLASYRRLFWGDKGFPGGVECLSRVYLTVNDRDGVVTTEYLI